MKYRFYTIVLLLLFIFLSACSRRIKYRGEFIDNRSISYGNSKQVNTGYTNKKVDIPLEYQWEGRFPAVVVSGLIGSSKFIAAGDYKGNLFLLNSINGKKIAKKRFKGGFSAPPVIVDTMLVYATDTKKQHIGVINLRNGKIIWKRRGNNFETQFAVHRNVVYIGDDEGIIYAWNLLDGRRIWRNDIGGAVSAGCAIVDTILITATRDQKIIGLDYTNGQILWETDLHSAAMGKITIVDAFVYCSDFGGNIYKIRIDNGRILDQYGTSESIRSGISYMDGVIYACSNDGILYAITDSNFTLLFKYKTDGPLITSALVSEEKVLFGSLNGHLYVLNRTNGKKMFEYDAGSPIISEPVNTGNYIVFCCRNRKIYAFQ
ncbi:MAG: PQQ-like beta-propeller repeat protein [candidate division Zixibacteria bacterium]|nr:PQQ-like beta-propeller repeat protein [candidate division Zixibacteria bacterium]